MSEVMRRAVISLVTAFFVCGALVIPADSQESIAVTPVTIITAFVTRLYQQVLGREPEPGAVDVWVQQIREDGSVIPTVFAFFESPEFLSRNTSDEQFVTILYRAIFGREPDFDRVNVFLKNLLDGRLTRQNLLDIFLDPEGVESFIVGFFLPHPDALSLYVINLYVHILHRRPDPAGLQSFVNLLQQTRTVLPTVQIFLASQEFQARTTTDPEFVSLLYRAFLNRIPDPQGLASSLTVLAQGTVTRDQLMVQFAGLLEAQVFQARLFPIFLTNGVPVNGSVQQGGWVYYSLTVPAGATQLTVSTTDATGDVDLYVSIGRPPTESNWWMCRPFLPSGNETCVFPNSLFPEFQIGTWYIGVNGFASGRQSFTVTATYQLH
jgi:hypothetical protein